MIEHKVFQNKNGSRIGYYLNPTNAGNAYGEYNPSSGVFSMENHRASIRSGKWPVYQQNLDVHLDFGDVNCCGVPKYTVTDLQTLGAYGTLVNGASLSSVGQGSVFFNGANQQITLAPNLFRTPDPFTFEIWQRRTDQAVALSNGISFATELSRTAGLFQIGVTPGNPSTLFAKFYDGINYTTVGVSYDDLNKWVHLVVTRDALGNVKIYANYTTSNTSNIGIGYWITGGNAVIGRNPSTNNERFIGYVAGFRYYSKQLSDAEVLVNFNCQRQRFGV